MDIAKIRVPWWDDLMNVKILFSCWPKYLYTHIWPQNIEKWGKTVILLVKWWISNFRPPSGGLSFGACGTVRVFDKLYPLNRTHVFRKNQRWNPPGWGHGVHSSCWNLEGKYFFHFSIILSNFLLFFVFIFLWHFKPPSHIFQTKKFITITLFMIFNKME